MSLRASAGENQPGWVSSSRLASLTLPAGLTTPLSLMTFRINSSESPFPRAMAIPSASADTPVINSMFWTIFMVAPVPDGPQCVKPEPRSVQRCSTAVIVSMEPPMRKLPNPAAIISGEPMTGLSRMRSAGPTSTRRRIVSGATVLTLANTVDGPSAANTPSVPRQTSSTA